MSHLAGKHIVLGLSGGIAAFKSAELCRALVKAGATVQVVMTEAAAQFITPMTLQALSNRPVYGHEAAQNVSGFDGREANGMPHINLSRAADAILVAPCSADFMVKLVHGGADDLLSLMCLARPIDRVPLLLAPAMNREMWAHPATQRNVHQLADELPDARDRLAYVGKMTEDAAMKVLNMVDAAQPVCQSAATEALTLADRLQGVGEHAELGLGEARAALARSRRQYSWVASAWWLMFW